MKGWFYKALYGAAPRLPRLVHVANIDAYKSGQVALQMNPAFIFRRPCGPNVGGDRSGYFPNPAGPGGHFAQLGARISWSPTPMSKTPPWSIFSGSRSRIYRPNGGSSVVTRLSRPWSKIRLPPASPMRRPSWTHGHREGLWAEPSYASLLLAMQDHVHKYVIAGEGTRKKRSTTWSKTGSKSSKTKANSNDADQMRPVSLPAAFPVPCGVVAGGCLS